MTQKTKARQQTPGKDNSRKVLAHCAACGAPIIEGDHVAYCVIPVGLTFSGSIIAERLAVCSDCEARAKSSAAGEATVNDEIFARYLAPDDEQGADADAEIKAFYAAGGRFH